MKIGERLKRVTSLVPASQSMADIGTDHGYIPLSLLEEDRVSKAIACDINRGPLERAKEHIIQEGKYNNIEIRLGAGLEPVSDREVDGVVIAGMGGLMILQILEDNLKKAQHLHWLVLQPQNHVAELKRYLSSHGFKIEKEELALEGYHLYEMFRAVPGEMSALSFLEAEIGCTEEYKRHPLFNRHLKKLINKRNDLIRGIAEDTDNERNYLRRQKAVEEKEILEAFL